MLTVPRAFQARMVKENKVSITHSAPIYKEERERSTGPRCLRSLLDASAQESRQCCWHEW